MALPGLKTAAALKAAGAMRPEALKKALKGAQSASETSRIKDTNKWGSAAENGLPRGPES